MKKELSIPRGNPQSCEEIAHANPQMFVMVIHLAAGPLFRRPVAEKA